MDRRTLVAEFTGTATLLAVVVGSAEMAARLAPQDAALALLCNTLATGAGLFAVLVALADTGASLNPAAALLDVVLGRLAVKAAIVRVLVQTGGALAGVVAAHAMFDLPFGAMSTTARAGGSMVLSEILATAGLLVLASRTASSAPARVPVVVAAWVVAGYWCTRSMCFANPAVTLARTLTTTAAGIAPASAGGFVVGELLGVALALILLRLLAPTAARGPAADVPDTDGVLR
jgi:glycerol uptake facilitator-like aquaporin